MKEEEKFEGFIDKIMLNMLNDKLYKIGVEVPEARPIVCKKCGASFQMKYGEGRCDHCGTYYTTHCYIEETEAR